MGNWIQNLRIGKRLGLGFGAIILLLVAETIATDLMEARIEAEVEEIYSDNIKKTELLETMSEQTHIVSRRLRTVLLLRGAEGTKDQLKGIEQARAKYDAAWVELQKTPAGEAGKKLRAKIDASKDVARRENGRVLDLSAQGQYDAAFQALLAARDEVEAWQAALDENVVLQQKQNAESFASIKKDFKFAETMTLGFGGAAVLIAVLLARLSARSISVPVAEVRSALRQVSNNNFGVRVAYQSSDELGEMAADLNATLDRLCSTFGAMTRRGEELARAAVELADVSRASLDSVHAQQGETQQVATAMNEMAATVQEVARNTQLTASAASQSQQEADTGKRVIVETRDSIQQLDHAMLQANQTIEALNTQSDKIGVVIEVIRSVADQTNLLALNAAIEAARAGEQGRGFAVVADEVRSLAGRTQASTGEIDALVSSLQTCAKGAAEVMALSRAQVEKGVAQTEQACNALDTIVAEISKIADMTQQVASATTEQSAVAETMSKNIAAIQENAESIVAGSNQSSATVRLVATMAEELSAAMKQFQLRDAASR